MILIVKIFSFTRTSNSENISRVMSLRDATKKMSKSEESDFSRINLKDSADEITKKIKKAKSDSESIPDNIQALEKKPEALNLLNIYTEISKNKIDTVLKEKRLFLREKKTYRNIN